MTIYDHSNKMKNYIEKRGNFEDFTKAFNLVAREVLWGIMGQYGVPEKLVKMIRALYVGFECVVIHEGIPLCWSETGVPTVWTVVCPCS